MTCQAVAGTAVNSDIVLLAVRLIVDGEHLIDPAVVGEILRDLIEVVRAVYANQIVRLAKLLNGLIHESCVFRPESDRTPRIRPGNADVVLGVGHIDKVTMAFKPGNTAVQNRQLVNLKVMTGKDLGVFCIAVSCGGIDGQTTLGIAVCAYAGFILGTLFANGVAEHTGGDGRNAVHFALRVRDKNLFYDTIIFHCMYPFLTVHKSGYNIQFLYPTLGGWYYSISAAKSGCFVLKKPQFVMIDSMFHSSVDFVMLHS